MEEERDVLCVGSCSLASRSSERRRDWPPARKETGAPRTFLCASPLSALRGVYIYLTPSQAHPFVRRSSSRSITRQGRRSSACTAAVSPDGRRTRAGWPWMWPSGRYRRRAIRRMGRRNRVRFPLFFPFCLFVNLMMAHRDPSKRPLELLAAYRHLEHLSLIHI